MGTTRNFIFYLNLADFISTQTDSCPFRWVSLIYTLLGCSLVHSLATAITYSLDLSIHCSWRLSIWCHLIFPMLLPKHPKRSCSLRVHPLKSLHLTLEVEESPHVWLVMCGLNLAWAGPYKIQAWALGCQQLKPAQTLGSGHGFIHMICCELVSWEITISSSKNMHDVFFIIF